MTHTLTKKLIGLIARPENQPGSVYCLIISSVLVINNSSGAFESAFILSALAVLEPVIINKKMEIRKVIFDRLFICVIGISQIGFR